MKTNMIQLMTSNEEKIKFSGRLKELCDDRKLPIRGRQKIIATYITRNSEKISSQAVGKWFRAEGYPKQEHMKPLCDFFNANYEWLFTESGDKYRPDATDNKNKISKLIASDNLSQYGIDLSKELTEEERHEILIKIVTMAPKMSDKDLVQLYLFSKDSANGTGKENIKSNDKNNIKSNDKNNKH